MLCKVLLCDSFFCWGFSGVKIKVHFVILLLIFLLLSLIPSDDDAACWSLVSKVPNFPNYHFFSQATFLTEIYLEYLKIFVIPSATQSYS